MVLTMEFTVSYFWLCSDELSLDCAPLPSTEIFQPINPAYNIVRCVINFQVQILSTLAMFIAIKG